MADPLVVVTPARERPVGESSCAALTGERHRHTPGGAVLRDFQQTNADTQRKKKTFLFCGLLRKSQKIGNRKFLGTFLRADAESSEAFQEIFPAGAPEEPAQLLAPLLETEFYQ